MMAKNNLLKKHKELEDDFDCSEELSADEAMIDMMSSLIDASNNQTMMAIELTKLVVAKSPDQNMTEDKIFAAFKQASKIMSESFPLKPLWEKFS